MAHSKAPWTMEIENGRDFIGDSLIPYTKKTGWINAADGTRVVQYAGCGTHEAEIENPDDEALILAAPELLAALKQLREAFVIAVGDSSPFAKVALQQTDEALAKSNSGAKSAVTLTDLWEGEPK